MDNLLLKKLLEDNKKVEKFWDAFQSIGISISFIKDILGEDITKDNKEDLNSLKEISSKWAKVLSDLESINSISTKEQVLN